MKRKIIHIDKTLCNGCGLCVHACHEGAIALVGGTAQLVRDDYCDALGDCLPVCPTGAISFIEREAAAFDKAAVLAAQEAKKQNEPHRHANTPVSVVSSATNTPSTPNASLASSTPATNKAPDASSSPAFANALSELHNWPIQIKLTPITSPAFEKAHLLIAADCTAFAYKHFHSSFMQGHTTLIACPKLDNIDYTEKLSALIANNTIQSITVARMEVPCCQGIEHAARRALEATGKQIDFHLVVLSRTGTILVE